MDDTSRPTERHYKCPNCKVPRFLAAAGRALYGTLRIKCPKCRKSVTFDLSTGEVVTVQVLRTQERELRCGSCRWFLAGVVVEAGDGHVRVQCPNDIHGNKCKRNNRFSCTAMEVQEVELPVG